MDHGGILDKVVIRLACGVSLAEDEDTSAGDRDVPADLALFDHVQRVPAGDARARWDGHSAAQKYLRIRTHTAVLCMSDDDTST